MPETYPKYDRLKLTEQRISDIARDLRNVATLLTPTSYIGKRTVKSGLRLEKVTVPFGVVGIIYESRPNVTFDVFALSFKSGNACILKGGSDAEYSNKFIVNHIQQVLIAQGINPKIIPFFQQTGRQPTNCLGAVGYVDIIIPRGSQNLNPLRPRQFKSTGDRDRRGESPHIF